MASIPDASFAYLTRDERNQLVDAFVEADIDYDRDRRAQMLDGVDRLYARERLPIVQGTYQDQVDSDLRRMNQIRKLANGTIPLVPWLRNGIRVFRGFAQVTRFEDALEKVSSAGETTAGVVSPNDVPSVDFEELITDGIDDLQEVSFLRLGALRLAAVAKLLVPVIEGGQQSKLPDGKPENGAGTGWLIGSDLLLTSYHVIRNRHPDAAPPSGDDLRLQALGTQARFFYDTDNAAGTEIGISDLLAVGKPKTQDYALLRLVTKPNIDYLPILNEQVTMPQSVKTPKGTAVRVFVVNIIQHPNGGPKRVALRNNLVYAADYPRLHYFTDTLGGSSGSPVFNDQWRVVALHRGARPMQAEFQGRRVGYVNEGIQIHAILTALDEQAQTDQHLAAALDQIRQEQAMFDDA